LSIDNISNKDSVFIYYCNDIDSNYTIDLTISFYDNKGESRYKENVKQILVQSNISKKIISICLKDIEGFNPKTDYIYVEGDINGKTIDAHSFFVKPKDYIRPIGDPKFKTKKVKIKRKRGYYGKKYNIYLKSDNVIRNTVIELSYKHSSTETIIMDILPHKNNFIYSFYKNYMPKKPFKIINTNLQ
ncbi:MAG TPA: hypothetical protein GX005_04810, partial [Bacteroidales bacterium]|nr:hypothetical protein [Bacteroidales bacterium]